MQEPEGGWARSGHPVARAGRGAGSARARPGRWGMGTEPGGGSAAHRPHAAHRPDQQAELGAMCGDQGVRAGGKWRVPSAPEPISGYLWDVRCCSTFQMKLGTQLWSGEDPGVVSTDTAG